jgi:hypothetical protein
LASRSSLLVPGSQAGAASLAGTCRSSVMRRGRGAAAAVHVVSGTRPCTHGAVVGGIVVRLSLLSTPPHGVKLGPTPN